MHLRIFMTLWLVISGAFIVAGIVIGRFEEKRELQQRKLYIDSKRKYRRRYDK